MNKPASELIALADLFEVCARGFNPQVFGADDRKTGPLMTKDQHQAIATLLRTAANQSGSERAGVDALREALKPFAKMAGAMYVSGHCGGASPEDWPDRWYVTVQGGKHFHTPQQHGGYLTVADFRRAAEALATPPAQPAPAAIHDGAVREAKSESQAKATEGKTGTAGVTGPVRRSTTGTGLRVGEASADLPTTSEIMDVTAGETAPLPSEAPSTHGKPDGAVREALLSAQAALSDGAFTGPLINDALKKVSAAIDLLDVKAEAKSQEPEARPVAIKPLEWEPAASIGITSYRATAIGIRYYVYLEKDDELWHAYTEGYQHASFAPTRSLDAAKAAAQADYEQRIRSALISLITGET